MTLLLPLLGFVFVSLLVAGAALALAPQGAGVIERRLGEMGGATAPLKESEAGFKNLISALKTLGARAPGRFRNGQAPEAAHHGRLPEQ